MLRPKVFVTRKLPDPVMSRLRREFAVRMNPKDGPLSRAELVRGIQGVDGMITMLSDTIDAKLIRSSSRLKIIANYAVGTNNIDLRAASKMRIAITNTPGVLTETVADLTWGLMIAVARRIPESELLVRSGKWTGWAPTQLLGADVYGKTLGILGIGRIGKAVARRASGFSMEVIYHSRHRLSRPAEKKLKTQFASLSNLLKRSDIVSIHIPLSKNTRHMINRKALSLMKQTAILINTARGPVVDEKALIDALERRKIAGAGFDVYEGEPKVPASLRRLKNVVLLPHIGSASDETRLHMGLMVIENLSAFFSGKRPPNQVN